VEFRVAQHCALEKTSSAPRATFLARKAHLRQEIGVATAKNALLWKESGALAAKQRMRQVRNLQVNF
jgi:hypothetical protein